MSACKRFFVNSDINYFAEYTDGYYQDKTLLILEMNRLINNANEKFVCVTRPRRFGKSMAFHMLNAYYSKGCDTKDFFSNFLINDYCIRSSKDQSNRVSELVNKDLVNQADLNNYEYEDYTKHINGYEVINIDFNLVVEQYQDFCKSLDTLSETSELYNRKAQKNPSLDLHEFKKALKSYSIIDYLKLMLIDEFCEQYPSFLPHDYGLDLIEVLKIVAANNNLKFIFLIDEWDVIFRDFPFAHDLKLHNDYVGFLSSLFKTSFSQKVALAYITGILPIQKYYSESSLNNFNEYSMLKPQGLGSYFGFTKVEAQKLCEQYNFNYANLSKWYNGYTISGNQIYNPYSVIKAIKNRLFDNYWSKTSASKIAFDYIFGLNDQLNKSIRAKLIDIQTDFVKLMLGESIIANLGTFDGNPLNISEKAQLYSFLVCLGYLTFENLDQEMGYKKCRIRIPNEEISTTLRDELSSHYHKHQSNETITKLMNESNHLLDLILSHKDGGQIAKIIEDFHNNSVENISHLEYNSEAALRFTIQTLLLFATADRYRLEKEVATGLGFADLIYVPLDLENDLPIIIELKIDQDGTTAINQIKSRHYDQKLRQISKLPIICVGINYNAKSKKHDCEIELLE